MLEDREQNLHIIGEYHLDVIPLDSDLLSLQLPQSFKVRFIRMHIYVLVHTHKYRIINEIYTLPLILVVYCTHKHTCMYAYTYIHTYTHVRTHTYMHIHTHTHTHMYTYTHPHTLIHS